MPVVAPTPVTTVNPWPSLSMDEAAFALASDQVGLSMPGTVGGLNALAANVFANAQYVESAANAGLASSNFKGAWSGLTGALNMPASVFDNGMYWQLLANLANVATDRPGVTANWTLLPGPPNALNFLDNGGLLIQQVTGTVLTSSSNHSNADRFYVAAGGGTSISGTNGIGVATGFATGRGVGAVAATFTTGTMLIKQRTESARTAALNSKTITISCKVWHDFGSTRNVTLQLYKCNAIDNWAALTSISTSAAVACASGAYTTVKHTITLGAADATNGFELVLQDTATATVISKSFLVSEWKMEVGSVATPFQLESYDEALRRCQRYYEVMGAESNGNIIMGGWAPTNPTPFYCLLGFSAKKWKVSATITIAGTWFLSSMTTPALSGLAGSESLTLYSQSSTSGAGVNLSNSGGSSRVIVDARL